LYHYPFFLLPIAAKVIELTEQRKGKRKKQPRIQHHSEIATGFKQVIDNKQRRTTTRRQRIAKEENAKLKEMNLTNDIPIPKLYTNNTQTYDFEDDSEPFPH
jgi:hypothetical protein